MLAVNVIGEPISEQEKQAYVERAMKMYAAGTVRAIDIHVDGEFVELTYHFASRPFERLRRITGYLVGTMDRWNTAKRAEEAQRVKHIGGPR